MKTLPTFEQIESALSYDPETGELTWKDRGWIPKKINTRFSGKPAGAVQARGYVRTSIHLNGEKHLLMNHRIAWILMTGSWPSSEIDHRDGNTGNNKWSNLRIATRSQNISNTKLKSKHNEKGCVQSENGEKWYARIKSGGKYVHLGTFDTLEDASRAFKSASEEKYGEFAHHLRAT